MSKQVDLRSGPVRFKLGDYNAYYLCRHDKWGLENLYGAQGDELYRLASRPSPSGVWKRETETFWAMDITIPTIIRDGAKKICRQEVVMILFQIPCVPGAEI